MTHRPRLSVVIATYNRAALLRRLLGRLGEQTLAATEFEVVVVDDGSAQPVRPLLADLAPPFALRVERQENAGAAAARHRGILMARGEVVVIVDDDMQFGTDFLELHLAHHADGARVAVLGRIAGDPRAAAMPLFERWHQRQLDAMAEDFRLGRRAPSGLNLYTGNVSFQRADYLATGGFDATLGHSEDAELGVRLQKQGVRFVFDEAARVLHGSDHTRLDRWRARAERYGVFDHRIARKHRDRLDADPWHYLFQLNFISRPLVLFAVAAPRSARVVAAVTYGLAEALDQLGFRRPAMAGATLTFGLDYFRGLRRELGSAHGAALDLSGYLARRRAARHPHAPLARWVQGLHELQADQAAMRTYEARYGHRSPSSGSLPADVVERIGLQVLAAYRLSRVLSDLGHPLAAKGVSRMARYVLGSDVHWEASIAPGVLVVHGMGMAISHGARVGPGCILFQNVTLGLGNDPVTQTSGAPTLEEGVHVGPGCTLIGPITVGAHSKLAPGVLLTRSVPPNTVVEPAPNAQRERKHARRKTDATEEVRS